MASNISTIGFAFTDDEALRSAMLSCASNATVRLPCPCGNYGLWRSRTGAEIWFHLGVAAGNGDTEVFGFTPFFEGKSDVLLKITERITRVDDNAFEGAMTGWVCPDGSVDGSYPLVFDVVDYAARDALALPALCRVRLSGFARQIQAFASEDAYYTARGAPDVEHPKLSAQAFIPVGLFAATQAGNEESKKSPLSPSSEALLTGKILECRTFTNEATGQDFVWLLVESLDATFDILADPAVITGELTEGGTVEADVWMFGRFLV